jgi:methionyl-tRNA synthetase
MEHSQETGNVDRRYYITTAIDYPNAAPHIGHSQEKVAADVTARYRRLLGDTVHFSMGLDENSQHVVSAAAGNGVEIRTWVQQMNMAFGEAWNKLNISYDRWIRTSSEDLHFAAAQEMFIRAQERGDVYKAFYTGWYCPNCNTYYDDDELILGKCPQHPTIIPEWIEEENYFFALTRYSERLLAYIATHPSFVTPPSRLSEVMAFFRQGLRDFSISRKVNPAQPAWGVPVPGDPEQVLYVWFDALTNYLTAIGFPEDEQQFARYWPADAHVIGKDIIRFHCLYWPAMLMSADLPLPKQIAVHGFSTLEGRKISKSTGNVISPLELIDEFGADAVRYYLLRTTIFATDSDFTRAGLLQRYNDDLAKDLGNLLQRVVSMLHRYRKGTIPQVGPAGELELDLQKVAQQARTGAEQAIDHWEPAHALESIWTLVKRANQYLEQTKPWSLARTEEEHAVQTMSLNTVLASAAEALRLLGIYLAPFLPETSTSILFQLGQPAVQPGEWATSGVWGACPLSQAGPARVLFPRREATRLVEDETTSPTLSACPDEAIVTTNFAPVDVQMTRPRGSGEHVIASDPG